MTRVPRGDNVLLALRRDSYNGAEVVNRNMFISVACAPLLRKDFFVIDWRNISAWLLNEGLMWMSPRPVAVYKDCQSQKINFCELLVKKRWPKWSKTLREANIYKDDCQFVVVVQLVNSKPACSAWPRPWQRRWAGMSAMDSDRGFFAILMPQKLIPTLVAPGVKMKGGPESKCDGHERQT